jgi:uncharacterized membrane protein
MLNYLISAIIFVVLDGFYLNLIKAHFQKQISSIQGSTPKLRMIPTAITYVFLIFILEYFIISKKENYKTAFLLGFSIYAVYEFTNYSLFKNWTLDTVLIDTVWGGILFGLTTFLTTKITPIFK